MSERKELKTSWSLHVIKATRGGQANAAPGPELRMAWSLVAAEAGRDRARDHGRGLNHPSA